jgi:hypothetical protein
MKSCIDCKHCSDSKLSDTCAFGRARQVILAYCNMAGGWNNSSTGKRCKLWRDRSEILPSDNHDGLIRPSGLIDNLKKNS